MDFHVHTSFSMDCLVPMEDMARYAMEKRGQKAICFTDHIDLDHPYKPFDVDGESYLKKITAVQSRYPAIKLYAGLEIGYTKETHQRLVEKVQSVPLDYVLLSRHVVNGVDPVDIYCYFSGKTRLQAYREYLLAVLESVTAFPDYDAVAHIGYVIKNAPYKKEEIPLLLEDLPDIWEEILRFLAQNGKALEINTSRYEAMLDGIPGFDVVRRFKELGGEWVILGSDAHAPAGIAQGFDACMARLSDLGYRYLAAFSQRKLVPLALNKV